MQATRVHQDPEEQLDHADKQVQSVLRESRGRKEIPANRDSMVVKDCQVNQDLMACLEEMEWTVSQVSTAHPEFRAEMGHRASTEAMEFQDREDHQVRREYQVRVLKT